MPLEGRLLRLVVYNTRYGTGTGWAYHAPFPFAGSFRPTGKRAALIAEFISSLDPDIVGLVETDGGSFRHRGRSQPGLLAARLGHNCIFTSKYYIPRFSSCVPVFRHQGNAVVTSLPVVRTSVKRLRKGIKNAVLETEFDMFDLNLVHLSLGGGARRDQIRELAYAARVREKPMVIAGDFNILGGEAELGPLFEAGLVNADPKWGRTYPSRNPRLGLDLILHSPEVSVSGVEIPNVDFSDHLPVVCDFTVLS